MAQQPRNRAAQDATMIQNRARKKEIAELRRQLKRAFDILRKQGKRLGQVELKVK